MKFVNLTPHKITINRPDADSITIEPSGTVARVQMKQSNIGSIDNIPFDTR
ncbi:MAG: hypothetical protein OXL96_13780 [Candidatus Poribacteria bacterium]|nr:hypothetical protein [Candidatus Poribacteria bacterium]